MNTVRRLHPFIWNLALLIGFAFTAEPAAGQSPGINGANTQETIKNRVTFIEDAIKNGRARGAGQMPAELLDGQDAQNVANFVAQVAGR